MYISNITHVNITNYLEIFSTRRRVSLRAVWFRSDVEIRGTNSAAECGKANNQWNWSLIDKVLNMICMIN